MGAHCTISLQFSCKPETALKCLFFKNTRNGLLSLLSCITYLLISGVDWA